MVVITDSAMVFEKPDMDSDTLAYLNVGQAVRVSKKIYGLDPRFYKISLPDGKFGYVATIDVGPVKSEKEASRSSSAPKPADLKREERMARARLKSEMAKPMMFNTWFGAALGRMTFKEKIPGVKAEEDLLVYGLKVTGPDVLLQGPIMDVNVMLHYGAPSYYESLSRVKPSGFIFSTDALLIVPFGMGQDTGLYFGLGPWARYSSFKYVNQTGALQAPSKFGIGAAFALGGAYRIGAFSLRLEGKRIWESSTQTVLQLGLQTLY